MSGAEPSEPAVASSTIEPVDAAAAERGSDVAPDAQPSDRGPVHLLHRPWTLFFMRRGPGGRAINYNSNIRQIASVSSVEEFWHYHNFMIRPNELPNTSDYHLFKTGITPTWEDEANALGGKWLVRLKKGLANRCWEDLLLALIGEQFGPELSEQVCGAVLSVRYSEDIIALWNKDASSRKACIGLREQMRRVMPLCGKDAVFEYKAHQKSLKDKSSFRNTNKETRF